MDERDELIATILQRVAGIGRELTAARAHPLGDLRLSRSQLDALFLLSHAEIPVTAGSLATTLGVTPGAVTQLVAGLREHGLVETTIDDDDARVRVIRLTPSTRARVDAFERAAVDRLSPSFAALDTHDLRQLCELLRKREERP